MFIKKCSVLLVRDVSGITPSSVGCFLLARTVLGNIGLRSFCTSRPRANIPRYGPRARLVSMGIGQVLFLRVYGPRRSRGPKTRKKRTRPISSHLDGTNLVNKGFIIWLLVKFCLRDTAGSPERARWLHLACSGSQSQRAIWFILPARGASHIIRG